MKTFILAAAAAFAFTVPASAQDTAPPTATAPGSDAAAPGSAGDAMAGPTSNTAPTTDPAGAPAPAEGGMNAPSGDANTAPAGDAATASPPVSGANTSAATQPQAAGDYPPCSRTVKDKCINRGAKPRR